MINKAKFLLLFLLLTLPFGVLAHNSKGTEKKDLPNFAKINKNLYRGAQPSEAGIERLKKEYGIKTIVYLRRDEKRANKEKKLAKAMGITFVHIPMNNWLRPQDPKIRAALAEINKKKNQPIFVHCKRGADRTGTVIAAYRMTHDDYTAKQAMKEAKTFGIGWWQVWMKDYIHDFYQDLLVLRQIG